MDLSIILESLPEECSFLKDDERFRRCVEMEKDFGIFVNGILVPSSAEQILSLAALRLLRLIQCPQDTGEILSGCQWDGSQQYNDRILCALTVLCGQSAD